MQELFVFDKRVTNYHLMVSPIVYFEVLRHKFVIQISVGYALEILIQICKLLNLKYASCIDFTAPQGTVAVKFITRLKQQ